MHVKQKWWFLTPNKQEFARSVRGGAVLRKAPMTHHKRWLAALVASTAVVGLAMGGAMAVLGRRFLEEFTRPVSSSSQGRRNGVAGPFPKRLLNPPTGCSGT